MSREGRVLCDLRRDIATESSVVKLEGKMVEARSKVEKSLAHKEGPIVRKWLDLANVKAILQSFSMALRRDGPSFTIHTPVKFVFEGSVVCNRPLQAGNWAFQTPTHAVTLKADDTRTRPGTGADPGD